MSFRSWLALLVVYLIYLTIGGVVFRSLECSPDRQDPKVSLPDFVGGRNENASAHDGSESATASPHFEVAWVGWFNNDASIILKPSSLRTSETAVYMLQGCQCVAIEGEDVSTSQLEEHSFDDLLEHTSSHCGFKSTHSDDLSKCNFDRHVSTPQSRQPQGNGPEGCSWDYYDSFFFSFTAITTIGYGHLVPKTDHGKLFTIFYSLLGIPINGILIGSMARFFDNRLKAFRKDRPRDESNKLSKIAILLVHVVAHLVPGMAMFMLLPAIIFFFIEDSWTYLDSLYFTFITLATIGFGDYVPGRNPAVSTRLGGWKALYEVLVIVWIIFGLGYLLMLISIITRGIMTPTKKAIFKLKQVEKQSLSRLYKKLMRGRENDAGPEDVLDSGTAGENTRRPGHPVLRSHIMESLHHFVASVMTLQDSFLAMKQKVASEPSPESSDQDISSRHVESSSVPRRDGRYPLLRKLSLQSFIKRRRSFISRTFSGAASESSDVDYVDQERNNAAIKDVSKLHEVIGELTLNELFDLMETIKETKIEELQQASEIV